MCICIITTIVVTLFYNTICYIWRTFWCWCQWCQRVNLLCYNFLVCEFTVTLSWFNRECNKAFWLSSESEFSGHFTSRLIQPVISFMFFFFQFNSSFNFSFWKNSVQAVNLIQAAGVTTECLIPELFGVIEIRKDNERRFLAEF